MPGVAITRDISPSLAACELTYLPRVPIDIERARAQHCEYERALGDAGYRVERLSSTGDMPDSVFVEDIAVVFDELAIVTRSGAESRRVETAAIADALKQYRPLRAIEAPGTIDGGDVLIVGRQVFVGMSTRTTGAAVIQMDRALRPHGYTLRSGTVRGCLHLKSAVTALDDETVLVNPEWIDRTMFDGLRIIEIDPAEPSAANALRLDDRLVFPASFPRTAARLEARGYRLAFVDASELAKAEGAVTCCSLIVANRKSQVESRRSKVSVP
jgi:dimethylargininase